ncbi:MAG: hypothetical protein ABIP74_03980 [Candidatus Saccharimonas sp.]
MNKNFEQLLDTWRGGVLGLSVIHETYEQFDQEMLRIVRDIVHEAEQYISTMHANDYASREVRYFVALIQDGYARLDADLNEGMPYATFHVRLNEEKRIWFEQLRVRESSTG